MEASTGFEDRLQRAQRAQRRKIEWLVSR